ncbi:MAG: type IV secretory pathway protein, partial [Candidatus Heimdallarchaeota archaeon]
REDNFTFYGRSYIVERIRDQLGWTDQECWDEIEKRKTVLRWMVKKKIRHWQDVATVVREYYSNPQRTYDRAVKGLE